jgi:cyclase
MRRVRIIAVLLLDSSGGLVKTIRFGKRTYIGDPINAVRIFNDKGCDELAILDIDATVDGREPNYSMLEEIAGEAFMPVGYGGGITSVLQMKRLFRCGVEKVILSTQAHLTPELVTQGADQFGAQSIVVCLDVKKTLVGGQRVFVKSGRGKTGLHPWHAAKQAVKAGCGEIIVQNIDRDGTFKGYDSQLIKSVAEHIRVPVIGLGGASTLDDCIQLIEESSCSAVAAGSMFVYHGKTRGVLISYPSEAQLQQFNERLST